MAKFKEDYPIFNFLVFMFIVILIISMFRLCGCNVNRGGTDVEYLRGGRKIGKMLIHYADSINTESKKPE